MPSDSLRKTYTGEAEIVKKVGTTEDGFYVVDILRKGFKPESVTRKLLAPIYSRFTEAFDTKDLKEANASLAQFKNRPIGNRSVSPLALSSMYDSRTING